MSTLNRKKFNELLDRLQKDYPELTFLPGRRFLYHPPATIYYIPYSRDLQNYYQRPDLLLLHELGHKIIKHNDYQSDVELLRIESEAWAAAAKLCQKYHINYDEDFAEERIDSYRDWLHYNSSCPNCGLNGYQDKLGQYHCPLCGHKWKRKLRPH